MHCFSSQGRDLNEAGYSKHIFSGEEVTAKVASQKPRVRTVQRRVGVGGGGGGLVPDCNESHPDIFSLKDKICLTMFLFLPLSFTQTFFSLSVKIQFPFFLLYLLTSCPLCLPCPTPSLYPHPSPHLHPSPWVVFATQFGKCNSILIIINIYHVCEHVVFSCAINLPC